MGLVRKLKVISTAVAGESSSAVGCAFGIKQECLEGHIADSQGMKILLNDVAGKFHIKKPFDTLYICVGRY